MSKRPAPGPRFTLLNYEHAHDLGQLLSSPLIARDAVGIPNSSDSRNGVGSPSVSGVAVVDDSRLRRKVMVGRNIRLGRVLADTSQRQLGCRIDREPRHISDWENGKHEPSPESLALLAEALGQEEHWFLTPHPDEWEAHGI